MDKKGISTVIATMIMITLVMAIVAIVWVSVRSLIDEQIETSESCFGNFGKVKLDKRYVCYNSSSNEFQFSISMGDIIVDSVLVSISSKSGTKSFKLSNNTISNVKMYNGVYGEVVTIPKKNSGFTYIADVGGLGIGEPDTVSIAPIINENQCEVSDSVSDIGKC